MCQTEPSPVTHGFVTGARMLFAFDGMDAMEKPFDFDDHTSAWRYAVEEVFDRPIA